MVEPEPGLSKAVLLRRFSPNLVRIAGTPQRARAYAFRAGQALIPRQGFDTADLKDAKALLDELSGLGTTFELYF